MKHVTSCYPIMHFISFLTWWSGFIFQQHVINTKTFASLPLKPPTKIQVTPDLASSHPPKIAYPMTSTIEIEKKESPTLDFLRATLKPFKEPSGTMWHDVVFRFPVFKISLLFHRPQGSNQKRSLSFWPTKILARLTWNPIRSWFGETWRNPSFSVTCWSGASASWSLSV